MDLNQLPIAPSAIALPSELHVCKPVNPNLSPRQQRSLCGNPELTGLVSIYPTEHKSLCGAPMSIRSALRRVRFRDGHGCDSVRPNSQKAGYTYFPVPPSKNRLPEARCAWGAKFDLHLAPIEVLREERSPAFVFRAKHRILHKFRDDLDQSGNLGALHALDPAKGFADPRSHRIDGAAMILDIEEAAIERAAPLLRQAFALRAWHGSKVGFDPGQSGAGKRYRSAAQRRTARAGERFNHKIGGAWESRTPGLHSFIAIHDLKHRPATLPCGPPRAPSWTTSRRTSARPLS